MRSKIVVTGIVLALITSCGKSPEKLLEIADQQTQAGEFDLAIETYNHIINNNGDDTLTPVAYYQLARLYLDRLNDYDQGRHLLKDIASKFEGTGVSKSATADLEYFVEWLKNTAENQRNKKEIQKSITTLNYLITNYHDDKLAPKAQYLIGDIYMNDLRDFQNAIDSYMKVVYDFAGTGQDAHAQFMVGYIYANVLNDNEKAKEAYSTFLKNYPRHELVPSVRFELEYLGMDINEIPVLKHIAGDQPALPQ